MWDADSRCFACYLCIYLTYAAHQTQDDPIWRLTSELAVRIKTSASVQYWSIHPSWSLLRSKPGLSIISTP